MKQVLMSFGCVFAMMQQLKIFHSTGSYIFFVVWLINNNNITGDNGNIYRFCHRG